ncbi:MAG: KpsF/GutQ family sugar-phosphate isomerase [Fimbriimonadaceae bacterium]
MQAVKDLERTLGPDFERAVDLALKAEGRVVTSGMGKAGLIARKVAATMSSTGTPAVFVHPAEGVHGDLGMIAPGDVVLAFSHRGQTEEVLRIIPYIKYYKVPLVAVTSNPESELAKAADVVLIIHVEKEACPMNLAPTTSTTAMLALGDTLALVLLEARGFGPEDYARRHPGGSLGRRLLTRVSDIMHTGDDNPVVPENATLQEAILVMTKSKLAATSVVAQDGKLSGFFTDGDLRRHLAKGAPNLEMPIEQLMTRDPKRAWPEMMAAKALEIMRQYKIIELPVTDEEGHPVGIIHLHDITRAGIS